MEEYIMTLPRFPDNMLPSVPSWFEKFFEGDWMDWNTRNFAGAGSTLPAVNIKENGNNFVIDIAAPGLKKDGFKNSYDNGR